MGKGGELELELVNDGPVLELGLAIAQRASGEGEEGRQWQGAREGRQGGQAAAWARPTAEARFGSARGRRKG